MFKNFWSRNVVIADSISIQAGHQTFLEKVRSFCAWSVDAVLTQKQVQEWYYWTSEWITKLDKSKVRAQANILLKEQTFIDAKSDLFLIHRAFVSEQCREDNSFITQKNAIIAQDVQTLLQEVEKKWEIISPKLEKTLSYYLEEWYLTIELIEVALMKYFQNMTLELYGFIDTPIFKKENGKKAKISEYHSVNGDLSETQREVLAYGMKKWFLDNEKLLKIVQALKAGGDDLEIFYKKSYKSHLFNTYLQSILNIGKKSL